MKFAERVCTRAYQLLDMNHVNTHYKRSFERELIAGKEEMDR